MNIAGYLFVIAGTLVVLVFLLLMARETKSTQKLVSEPESGHEQEENAAERASVFPSNHVRHDR